MFGTTQININFGRNICPCPSQNRPPAADPFMALLQSFMELLNMFSSQNSGGLAQPRLHFGAGPAPTQPGQSLSTFLGNSGNPLTSGTPSAFNSAPAASGSGGHRAVQTARQFIGERSWDIKGRMPYFRRAGGLTRNCADFVSAALQNGGMLGGHEVNVGRLEKRLLREGWVRVPNEQAGPGDVAITPTRSHVELCQGNGMTIGSNNVKPKLQYITERKLRRKMIVYRKL
jgi:hypothetical protein